MTRVQHTALLILLASLLLLGGCSLGRGDGGKPPNNDIKSNESNVELSFVYSGDDPTAKAALSEAVEAFTNAYPNITIVQSPSSPGSYTDYLQMKDVVGEFPDMMEMRDTQWYVDAGRLAELPGELTDLMSYPPEVNGKHYTLPLVGSAPSGFIYNREIFEQANIKEEPRTWEEFLEACAKIKELGIAPLVVGGKDIGHFSQLLNKLLMDNVFADDQNWNSKRTLGLTSFTDPGVMKAMNDFAELFQKGYVIADWPTTPDYQTITVLLSRKAAMIYGGSHLMNPIMDGDEYFKIGFFVPGDRSGRLVLNTLPGQAGLALSAEAAKDPQKLQAFTAFVHYFYSAEPYARFLRGSSVPSTSYKVEQEYSEPMQKVLDIAAEPHVPSRQMNDFWGENAMPPAFGEWFYQLVKESLLTGNPSIPEAMSKADEEWDRLIAERAASSGSTE